MEQYNPRDKFRSLKHIYIMNTSLEILSSDWHAALHNALPGANPFRTFDIVQTISSGTRTIS
jgi:hypothetical protein